MIKNVLFLALAFLGLSYSTDDSEKDSISNSNLKGRWVLQSRTSEIEEFNPLKECEKLSYYQFYESEGVNKFEFEYYKNSFLSDNCMLDNAKYRIDYRILNGQLITDQEKELGNINIKVLEDKLILTFTIKENILGVELRENSGDSYKEVEVYTRQ